MAVNNESRIPVKEFLWLDTSVDGEENRASQEKLRSFVERFQVFEEIDRCERYIQSVLINDQLVLIISGQTGLQVISRVHSLPQVSTVYIHCTNEELHQQWTEEYIKVKTVFSDVEKLIDQIGDNRRRRGRNPVDESLSMSILNGNIQGEQSTSDLDGRFVHSQLLTDCLLRMDTIATDRDDLISLCLEKYPDVEETGKHSDEFKETYSADQAIWWYTRETFVYRLLNKSLRAQDIDLLFGFRFLIRDIEQQLQQHRCPTSMCLYRGQLISEEELEILKQSVGKLISMNSFLSTTVDRDTACFYLATSAEHNNDSKSKPVLFEIQADPCQPGMKPFANISLLSEFPSEEEVLMMLGSVFRLDRVHLGQHHTWIINMTLCSDHDHDLRAVVDCMRNQYGSGQTRLLSFGHVLVDMSRFDDAEKYYRQLLKELPPDDTDTSLCYHSLAKVACEKAEYEFSLEQLQKSLDIAQRKLEKDHSRTGFIYTSMGEVYQKMNNHKRALECYEKALQIWKPMYQIDPQYIAWCLNNIGNVYAAEKKHLEALDYHQQAMELKNSSLPPSHPCLGNAHLNTGNVYYYMGQYDKALECYERAKEVYTTSLPPRHPSIASALKNIGVVYETQEKLSEALACYKTASSIRQNCFSSSHPDVLDIKCDIERVSLKIK